MNVKKLNLESLSNYPNLFLFCEMDEMRPEYLEDLKNCLKKMPVPEEFAGVDAALLHAAMILVAKGRLPLEHVPSFIGRACHLLGYKPDKEVENLATRIFYLLASP